MPVKEKLVKILAPGVGWIEMAAQNRRRNDTSRHAVGVWEEFSFLDKGSCVGFGGKRGWRCKDWEEEGERVKPFALFFPVPSPTFLFPPPTFRERPRFRTWLPLLFENGNQIIWRYS